MNIKGLFKKRCPLCNGDNLYQKGFMGQDMGCRDCEKKIKQFVDQGVKEEVAIQIMLKK